MLPNLIDPIIPMFNNSWIHASLRCNPAEARILAEFERSRKTLLGNQMSILNLKQRQKAWRKSA
jgi:hypothetical protein